MSIRKLDDFVSTQRIRRIDLLKIDVEGYELLVIEGASKTLKSGKVSFIYIEVGLSKERSFHIPLPKMIEVLNEFSFEFLGLFQTNYKHVRNGFSYSNALFIHSDSTYLLK